MEREKEKGEGKENKNNPSKDFGPKKMFKCLEDTYHFIGPNRSRRTHFNTVTNFFT